MITLSTAQLGRILAHAAEAKPNECCGLIGGQNNQARNTYPMQNVAQNPQLAYEAAPEDLFAAQREMRERGEGLLAIYHSHPRSSDPSPSETDVRLAYYPSATYLIIGLGGVTAVIKAFSISEREQRWQQVEYEITGE